MRGARVGASAVVVVVAASGMLAWRWQQRGPDHASVSAAVGRFRTSSTAPTAPTSVARKAPRPGVYIYAGTGAESLSFLSTRQGQGPTEPATVTLLPNRCWQFRIDFNSFHHQTWNRCSTGTRSTESGGTTDQRFDFVTFKTSEHSDMTCRPPGVVADLAAVPGASSPVRCIGRSQTTKTTFTQAGTAVFVGRETVVVGGVRVAAVHRREDLHMTGDQTGEVRIDVWFALSDFLPLKEAHTIRVVSSAPAPLNHVTYSEHGTWQLTSLTPRT